MAGRNFLFVPGPTNVPDRVLRAMMVSMEDHRSPAFPELTRTILPGLKKSLSHRARHAFRISIVGYRLLGSCDSQYALSR